MFSTFLETIGGYFNKRSLLSAFFPALAFGGLNLVVFANLRGVSEAVELRNAQPVEWQLFLAMVFFGSQLFLAYLLETFSVSLIRLYEGYWDNIPGLSWWGEHRRAFYQRYWDYLKDEMERLAEQIANLERKPPSDESDKQKKERLTQIDNLYAKLGNYERESFLFYPPPTRTSRGLVMPTQLGNILRAAELYALNRYEIDAVVTWPRLQSLLPEAFGAGLKDAKSSLDLLLNLTTLTVIFTLLWEVVLVSVTQRWGLFLIISLGWVVAYLTYQAALHAARTYAELIKAAYDLYRWRLLDHLHLKQPASLDEEKELWKDVIGLLYRNYPPKRLAFRYATAKAPDSTKEESPPPGVVEDRP